jgi:biopolymer transport protein ExbB/TolQ
MMRRAEMDGQQWIWIVVAVLIVVLVIAVVVFGRRAKTAVDRKRAAELRERARTDALGAYEHTAAAARAEADAHRAESEAERLHNEAMDKQKASERANEVSQDRLRRAEALDPENPRDRDDDAGEEERRRP